MVLEIWFGILKFCKSEYAEKKNFSQLKRKSIQAKKKYFNLSCSKLGKIYMRLCVRKMSMCSRAWKQV